MNIVTISPFLLYLLFLCYGLAPGLYAQDVLKEKVDSVMTIDGKKVIIEQEFHKFQGDAEWGYKRSLASYKLKDSGNKSHHIKEFTLNEASGGGFHEQFSIGISKLKTPGREALLISHGFFPSAPGSGVDLQLFAWREDDLISLSEPFEVSGNFGGIKREQEGVELTLSDTEVIMMTHHSTHFFYLDIPVIIDLDPESSERYRAEVPTDSESGFELMPVEAEIHPDFLGGNPGHVSLYSSPGGSEYTTVPVDRESEVKIGSAYGETKISRSETGAWVSYEIKRLEVSIDGKSGFVEEKDYQTIGLPAFG